MGQVAPKEQKTINWPQNGAEGIVMNDCIIEDSLRPGSFECGAYTACVSFLINSCDKYEDAWHPFFECLWHFAGELPYPIFLNTETKQFQSSHYNITCVNTRLGLRSPTWSERLLNVLNKVNTEFVFFLLEDYFLKDEFDRNRFEKVVSYMKEHPAVGIVDICPHWAESLEEAERNKVVFKNAEDSFAERNREQFNITCAPGIWRTDVLKELIRPHEDVWDFEYYVGSRAKQQGYKVVRFNTRTPVIYEYDYQVWSGMGITSGKWLPKNKEFFDSLGIKVNFDRLGIINVSSQEELRKRNRSNLLVMIKKIPRKIRKRLTRRKSLSGRKER